MPTLLQRKPKQASPTSTEKKSLFTPTALVGAALASLAYLVLSYFLIGFKSDQVVLVLLFNGLFFGSRGTRNFISAFSVFAVYWILFDYQKAFPNYRFNTVHIQELYLWEKSWFGIDWNNAVLTPNEFLAQHTASVLDLLSGAFYLCWIPVPLAFAIALYIKNRRLFFQFALTFVVVNLLGWSGYYGYPAAPPWYVAQHGFELVASTPGATAGLKGFDNIVGVPLFESIYEKSSNVFAAMPSLHSAYVLLVFFYSVKAKLKGWPVLFGVITAGIWFAAVYTSHHYVIDVLAGIVCGVAGTALFQWWARSKQGTRTVEKLVRATS